jgi:hypothetical protein
VNWEFWISVGVFAVLFVIVTSWAGRRLPEEQRRTHWLRSSAVLLVVVAALLAAGPDDITRL